MQFVISLASVSRIFLNYYISNVDRSPSIRRSDQDVQKVTKVLSWVRHREIVYRSGRYAWDYLQPKVSIPFFTFIRDAYILKLLLK